MPGPANVLTLEIARLPLGQAAAQLKMAEADHNGAVAASAEDIASHIKASAVVRTAQRVRELRETLDTLRCEALFTARRAVAPKPALPAVVSPAGAM